MNIKLPTPLSYNGNLYDEVNIKEYTAGVLADTKKEIDSGNPYKALQIFISGCINSINDVNEKTLIKILTGFLAYKSAELLAIKIITMNEKEDGIEGIYTCPRCGNKIACEIDEENGIDTSDHLNELKVEYSKDNELIEINLKNKIIIEDINENIIDEISSISLQYPTLNNCISACNSYGDKDSVRLELRIYVESLKLVNQSEIDNKWKNRFGMYVMERLCRNDLITIKEKLNQYGLKNEIKKKCPNCGKKFTVALNTASFFALALQ